MKHTYVSAERFILSREFFGMKLGLENISTFLRDIGAPQSQFASVHVAGTNGKGSTATILAAVFQQAGYRTGLFTSPHLVTFRERIRIDGQMIPKRAVTVFIDRHRRELSRRKISFFELTTALALDYFARAQVEIAIIETGLGGRLDATNVLAPELTIITDVNFDHMEILGHTLREIAFEKAGIIKPSVPNLIGQLAPEPRQVIAQQCRMGGAPLHSLSRRDFTSHRDTGRLDYHTKRFVLSRLSPAMVGPHQLQNAALVIKAATILKERGWRLTKAAIKKGITSAQIAGRFQIIERPGAPIHILDVGHNAPGMAAFVKAFQVRFPGRKAKVITGFVRLKQHREMISSLASITELFALVPLRSHRSIPPSELIRDADFGLVPYKKYGSLPVAHRHLLKSSRPDDIIVVVGSHYLVGEFLGKLSS